MAGSNIVIAPVLSLVKRPAMVASIPNLPLFSILPAGAAATEENEMAMSTEIAPADEVAKAGGDTETITIDKFVFNSSKPGFLALPQTDPECHSVDSENGLWVKCAVCDASIPSRAGSPFTLSRWIEHKAGKKHQLHLGCLKRSGLDELESSSTINRFQTQEAEDNQFLFAKGTRSIGAGN